MQLGTTLKKRSATRALVIVALAVAVQAPATASAQASPEMMKISSELSQIISTRSFFNPRPGVTAQQEWLQAGCDVNFEVVAAKGGDKVVFENQFKLSDLGAVTVNPTGTGGFTVMIASSDGTKRIPSIMEVFQQGTMTTRRPGYQAALEFMLSDRDDAYRVSDMLRTAIAACS